LDGFSPVLFFPVSFPSPRNCWLRPLVSWVKDSLGYHADCPAVKWLSLSPAGPRDRFPFGPDFSTSRFSNGVRSPFSRPLYTVPRPTTGMLFSRGPGCSRLRERNFLSDWFSIVLRCFACFSCCRRTVFFSQAFLGWRRRLLGLSHVVLGLSCRFPFFFARLRSTSI